MPSRSRPRERRSKSGKKKSRSVKRQSVKRQSVKRQSVKRRSARRQQLMPQDVMRGRRLRGGATKDELLSLVAELERQQNKSSDLNNLLAQATALLQEIDEKEPSSEQQARLNQLELSLGSHLLPEESQLSLGTNDPVIVPQQTPQPLLQMPVVPQQMSGLGTMSRGELQQPSKEDMIQMLEKQLSEGTDERIKPIIISLIKIFQKENLTSEDAKEIEELQVQMLAIKAGVSGLEQKAKKGGLSQNQLITAAGLLGLGLGVGGTLGAQKYQKSKHHKQHEKHGHVAEN